MDQTRRITVKIAGKPYAMTVPLCDEEKFRKAAKEINDLISSYKSTFAAEPEDYVAMAALEMAVHKVGLQMDRTLEGEREMVDQIGKEIDSYLSEIEP